MKENKTGKVYLVGAGPGDASLISLKGLEMIRRAEVIVYDHLVDPTLLNEAQPGATLICAGKRASHHTMKQADTNRLLAQLAMEGRTVVRLKGGDPFIFGRGGEEGESLDGHDIEWECIPGISSFYSVAESFKIPVTMRGEASSVHVITAHEDPLKDKQSIDYGILAREEGTLVFLMGLSRIGRIAQALIEGGKDPETPCAVVTNGTLPNQRCVTGPLKKIGEIAADADLTPPGILIVGEVTRRTQQIPKGPLQGKKILVTATKETASVMVDCFRKEGAWPVAMSLIRVVPEPDVNLTKLFKKYPSAWIVLTSRNGVEAFMARMDQEDIDRRCLGNMKFAVIGTGTAHALHRYGYRPDLMPEKALSSELTEALLKLKAETGDDRPVLLLRAKVASEIPVKAFAREGVVFEDVALYETRQMREKQQLFEDTLQTVDAVTFMSGSAVTAFKEMGGFACYEGPVICIGPVTAQAALEAGADASRIFTADHYSAGGVVAAARQSLAK